MRDTVGEGAASRCAAGVFTARLAAFILAILSSLYLAAPHPAQAQTFQFSNVSVSGNELIDNATIVSHAGIAPGQSISMGHLNAAYQRLVNSGLFEEVALEPRGNTLAITVREWPTVNVVAFEGNARLDDDVLRAVIQSQERRVYSPTTAEADARAITQLYSERGRLAAEVDPRIIRRSGNRVDLVFGVREGGMVEVERLSFVGNRSFSDYRLRQVLETKQAGLLRTIMTRDTFLAERVDLDRQLLRDFYLSRGYIDFEVLNVASELARERDAFFVTFTVREGQSYNIGNVTTVSEVPGVEASAYHAEQRLRSGVTYSPTVIETSIARMERLANQQGLRFVRVEPRITRDDANRMVHIQFTLVEGERIFVERIDIQGNATTLDRVVRRQFRIAEGDPMNPREVREAAERIRALGYFSQVEVEGRQGSAPDQVVVDVDLEETTTGSLGFGASYAVNAGIGFNVQFAEANFLGRGQRLELSFNTARDSRAFDFNFVEPAFLDRDLQAGIRLRYARTDGQHGANFDTRMAEVTPSLSFPLSEHGRLGLRYVLRRDDIRIGEPDEISRVLRADEGRFTTSSVGYTYTYDTRDSQINPSMGMVFRFSQDIAGLGGDRRYVNTTALAGVERRVFNEDVTLRAELEGGALQMLRGQSRVSERYFTGGIMRGFRPTGIGPRDTDTQDALGGTRYVVARFEADFPLGLPEEYGVAGGVFMDVGTLWGLDHNCTTCAGSEERHIRAAAGVSLFWDTPIGPLRFNFSRPIKQESYDKRQNFDLTVSTRF